MARKRIMHVLESTAGGTLRYVQQVCGSLDEDEWEIIVVYSRRADTPADLGDFFEKNVRLIECEMTREINLFKDFKSLLVLYKVIREYNADIIHLHSSKAGFLGRTCSLFCRRPIYVYTPHGFSFFRRDVSELKVSFYRGLEWFANKLSLSWVLVGSEMEYREAVRLFGEDKVTLILNSVFVDNSLISNSFDWDVVTVGRMSLAKQPFVWLDTITYVYKVRPQTRFYWIGDGELRQDIENLANKRKIPLTITGWLDPDRVREILSNSTVYLQCSSWEGLPLSLLEAMAQGCPIVVSDIQAHRDVIEDNVDGFLATTASDLAQSVIDLLSNSERAKSMGRRGREKVRRNYNASVFATKMQDYYKNLCEVEGKMRV